MARDFDPALARAVGADTLEPHQQPSPPRFKTAADFRMQWMRKHPHLSEFHSRAEHLHAGLLEGDPAVHAYVPQPFPLRLRGKRYTPDCYVAHADGPRRVIELKPDGVMADDRQVPLTHFFAQYAMVFEVIANEAVFAREIEADNWLTIVRVLHQARDFTTTEAEYALLERLYATGPATLGDLLDPGDRERTYPLEVGLFRLLHRGQLTAELAERPLDYDTGVRRCA